MKKVYLILIILIIIIFFLIISSFIDIPSPSKLINEEYKIEIK